MQALESLLYAKIGLKSLQEYSADNIQTTFSDAVFLGALRVKAVTIQQCSVVLPKNFVYTVNLVEQNYIEGIVKVDLILFVYIYISLV